MNKKLLGVLFSILTLAILVAPAMAGKGLNKTDFQIHLVGVTQPPPAKATEAGNNLIVKDTTFIMKGGLSWILLNGETITAENLGYETVNFDVQQHYDENGDLKFAQVHVNEIYYIYDEYGELRGTLEVQALGNNKVGTGANLVGKGTGEFDGLIITGACDPLYVVPNPDYVDPDTTPDEPTVLYVLDRIGTAMI